MPLSSIVLFAHLIGLALGVGSATVKLALRIKNIADDAFLPVYAKISKPVTQLIVLGMVLLTLSGIGWLLLGHSFTPKLILKSILVAMIWILGPCIDNVVEPQFKKLEAKARQQPCCAKPKDKQKSPCC